MADRKVLVTGVSGFVAGHVALALLNAGFSVRGSVRSQAKADRVRDELARAGGDVSRLDFVVLDLLDDRGWDDAMAGVDDLCHCASPFVAAMPADPQDLIRPAVEGTTRALEAALRGGVKQVVLTSSVVAVAYGGAIPNRRYTADDWSTVGGPGMNAYNDSKTMAEQAAWAIMDKAGARKRMAAVNPSLVLGPVLHGDLSTSTQIIRRMMKGEFPAAPRLHLSIVDVRDVAALHVAALNPALGGQRLLAAGKTLTMLEIARATKAAAPDKARTPTAEAPNIFIRLFGLFDKQAASIVPELGKIRHYDPSTAEAALGRTLIPAEDAIAATARSLAEQKLV